MFIKLFTLHSSFALFVLTFAHALFTTVLVRIEGVWKGVSIYFPESFVLVFPSSCSIDVGDLLRWRFNKQSSSYLPDGHDKRYCMGIAACVGRADHCYSSHEVCKIYGRRYSFTDAFFSLSKNGEKTNGKNLSVQCEAAVA